MRPLFSAPVPPRLRYGHSFFWSTRVTLSRSPSTSHVPLHHVPISIHLPLRQLRSTYQSDWDNCFLLTAVVDSIDGSAENRTPNRCLPQAFDGIGARHPE